MEEILFDFETGNVYRKQIGSKEWNHGLMYLMKCKGQLLWNKEREKKDITHMLRTSIRSVYVYKPFQMVVVKLGNKTFVWKQINQSRFGFEIQDIPFMHYCTKIKYLYTWVSKTIRPKQVKYKLIGVDYTWTPWTSRQLILI